ncbi:hypothetical protein CE91St9_34900 [Bacteroides thetaiotaomicron]|uniref:hypothetical protein n=1 Tax=Bacteroides thetaiotaomicron TaxID=818 RepID=UPI001FBA9C49|nr:hypothetical protein [Bacteroides thetaiotaomicron]GKH21882.1 hypothetical protein CE91St8_36170 [Bacteroides thetaiotaomicron]GKH68817.1 hypothetical protein CE91St9_34900 [Bacteroides thetaiotaomicron]
MTYFREAESADSKKYPLTITAEVKDKILNAILVAANGKAKARLCYEDISGLEISEDQYEMVVEEFKKKGLIDYKGYGIEELTLNSEISNFMQKGGFAVERDLYIINFDMLELQLKRLEKELSPDTATKVNSVIGSAKNITELILGLSTLADKIKF